MNPNQAWEEREARHERLSESVDAADEGHRKRDLITEGDLLKHLKVWGFVDWNNADIESLAQHLAGNLAQLAQIRAGKRLAAGERVATALRVVLGGNSSYTGRIDDLDDAHAALAEYKEISPDA